MPYDFLSLFSSPPLSVLSPGPETSIDARGGRVPPAGLIEARGKVMAPNKPSIRVRVSRSPWDASRKDSI